MVVLLAPYKPFRNVPRLQHGCRKMELGVFGSPTSAIGREVFSGDDQLDKPFIAQRAAGWVRRRIWCERGRRTTGYQCSSVCAWPTRHSTADRSAAIHPLPTDKLWARQRPDPSSDQPDEARVRLVIELGDVFSRERRRSSSMIDHWKEPGQRPGQR